jgi:hypothetical protein
MLVNQNALAQLPPGEYVCNLDGVFDAIVATQHGTVRGLRVCGTVKTTTGEHRVVRALTPVAKSFIFDEVS